MNSSAQGRDKYLSQSRSIRSPFGLHSLKSYLFQFPYNCLIFIVLLRVKIWRCKIYTKIWGIKKNYKKFWHVSWLFSSWQNVALRYTCTEILHFLVFQLNSDARTPIFRKSYKKYRCKMYGQNQFHIKIPYFAEWHDLLLSSIDSILKAKYT